MVNGEQRNRNLRVETLWDKVPGWFHRSLKSFRGFTLKSTSWNYMKLHETIWNHLELCGTTWNYLKQSETIVNPY